MSGRTVRPALALLAGALAWGLAALAPAGASAQERRIERVKKGAETQAGGDRWAVIIGIDQYQSPEIEPLSGAVADAKAIRDVLVEYADFPASQVHLLVSDGEPKPTPGNIMEKLEEIKGGVKPDHLLLVFFAGHGVQVDGQRYLLCHDTRISSTAALKTTSLPAAVLMQEIESIPVQNRLILVDACRSDPTQAGRPNVADEAFEQAFTLRPSDEGGVRATFLSCSRGQSAYEWREKRRGFFSQFVELGIKGDAAQFGKVTVTSLLTYLNEMVPQKVREQRNQVQIPYSRVAGSQLVLVRPEKLPQKPSALDAPAVVASRTVYGVVKDSSGVPLSGARIQVALAGGGRGVGGGSTPAGSVTSDEDGFFKLDIPPDSEASVTVALDGYSVRTVTSSPQDAGKKLSVFLPRIAPPPAAPVAVAPPPPVTAPPAPSAPPPTVLPATMPPATRPPAPMAPPPTAPPPTAPPATRPQAPVVPPPTPATRPPAPTAPPPTAPPATRPPAPSRPAAAPVQAPPPVVVAAPPPPPAPGAVANELALVAYRTFLVEEFEGAANTAREALAADHDNPLANAVLGNSLVALGLNTGQPALVDEARPHIAQALGLAPNLALAHNARALELIHAGAMREARTELETAVHLDTNLAAAHANLAFVLARENAWEAAERECRLAIVLEPDSAVPYNTLSDVLFNRGKHKDAVQASRDAISRYPLRDQLLGLFYVQLAVTQFQKGDRDAAKESVARAKALGVPTHPAYEAIEKGKPAKKKK